MDEIFGEENYRNLLIIRRGIKSVQDQFKHIDRLNYGAEYVLVYTKMIKAIDKKNREITQDEIDAWWLEKLENEEKFDLLRLSTTGKPEHYVPPSSDIIPSSLWSDLKPNGGHQFHAIMGEVSFDNPKSIDLINRLISFSCHDKNTIVLDSFAGSGTTAHAVLALNREDGGNRKFILVECEDYADTITAERVRRVIKGVPDARQQSLKAGLGGFFTYATLGDEIGAEGLLSGDAMPSWERLARYLFWLATGKTLEKEPKPNSEGYVGTARGDHVYLLYQPDIAFIFYEELEKTLNELVGEENITKDYVFLGIRDGENYPVDYCITKEGRESKLLIFGIPSHDKARLTTIILQHLHLHSILFRSLLVF